MDYENPVQDSRRWQKLAMRPDDIVIAAPVRSGTTWLQTICALLVLQRPELPAPLRDLSPWIDSRYRDSPGIVLVHYADLRHDLDGQMRRIAGRLGIDVPERIWPRLVRAASFEEMSREPMRWCPGRRSRTLGCSFAAAAPGMGRGS